MRAHLLYSRVLVTVSFVELVTLHSPWPSCKKLLTWRKTWPFLATSEPRKSSSGKSRPISSFTFCQGGHFTRPLSQWWPGGTSGSRLMVWLCSSVILWRWGYARGNELQRLDKSLVSREQYTIWTEDKADVAESSAKKGGGKSNQIHHCPLRQNIRM